MVQVGGAHVRLRPSLSPEDDAHLAATAEKFRAWADEIDEFRSQFVRDTEAVVSLVPPLPRGDT